MRKFALAALATLAVAASGTAQAAVIDFDALPGGAAGDPLALPGATFTALGGFNVIASGGLCASLVTTDAANCSPTLQVDFDQASSGLSFRFFANNEKTVGADIGDVQIFGGATLLGTLDLTVIDDTSATRDLVSLTGFSGVTRLLISSTDFGGVLYDDFTFTADSVVPEPATWALMIAGFGLAGGAVRRRRWGSSGGACGMTPA